MSPSKKKIIVQLLVLGTLALLVWRPGAQVHASPASFTLYGAALKGWGFTNETITSRGPDIQVLPGQLVELKLISADGLTHDFGVDYNNNTLNDPGESDAYSGPFHPSSPLNFNFTARNTPGVYFYYCYFHQQLGYQYGRFIIGTATPPTAVFNYSPTSPTVRTTITFNASSSYDPDGDIVRYDWSFGDGASASGQIVEHTYSIAGAFAASVRVRDASNYTDIATERVTVSDVANQVPDVSFTASPLLLVEGQSVQFDASASHDPDGDQIFYSWDFGDLSSLANQTQPSASHTYDAPGTFTTTLTVRDIFGARNQTAVIIGVEQRIQDLVVTGFVLTPSSARPREHIMINVTILNNGNVETDFQIQVMQGSTVIGSKLGTLVPADLIVESLNWTAPSSPGQFVVSAKVVPSMGTDDNPLDNDKLGLLVVVEHASSSQLYTLLGPALVGGVGLASMLVLRAVGRSRGKTT